MINDSLFQIVRTAVTIVVFCIVLIAAGLIIGQSASITWALIPAVLAAALANGAFVRFAGRSLSVQDSTPIGQSAITIDCLTFDTTGLTEVHRSTDEIVWEGATETVSLLFFCARQTFHTDWKILT